MAKQYKTISVDIDNLESLRAIAAQLEDETGVTHSINDVVSILRRKYEEDK
jgi:hypothetical protein